MNHSSFHLYSRNSLIILLMISGSLLMVSCEKETEPVFSNSIIYGTAELYWPPEGEYPDIKVLASGPYGQSIFMLGDNGNYQFSGLGNGTYYLEFSQDGYGTIRQYGIQLFGNDTVHAESVYLFKKISNFEMPTFTSAYSAMHNNRMVIRIETDLSRDDYAQGIPAMLFFDDQSNVSCESYQFSYPSWDSWFNYVEVPTIFVDAFMLPFESGTEVFVVGYVCNMNEYYNGYLDTYLGRRIYSTLDNTSHSNVISFIMP